MAKILIVEDDRLHIFLIKHALEKTGHEIIPLEDTDEFEDTIYKTQPNLIIMDLNLPNRSGMSLIHDLRTAPDISGIPVIVVTASALTGVQTELAELGCLGFISKPFRPEKLQDIVEEVLLATS